MPSTQIQNVAGAFGLPSLTGYTGDDRTSVVQTFLASLTTITRGDIVSISTSSGYVNRALTNTAAQLLVGVALDVPSAVGDPIMVATGGIVTMNKGTAAITAGDLVTASATITGSAAALAATTAITQAKDLGAAIGICLASKTAGDTTVDVFLVKI